MTSLARWLLPAVAVAATALAVWGGPNLAVAVPAATIAVLAAGLLFAVVWFDDRRRTPRSYRPHPPRDVLRLRFALRSGRLGREEIVTMLDGVERGGPNPALPNRTVHEMDVLVRLPAAEFRSYLRTRLDDLEVRL